MREFILLPMAQYKALIQPSAQVQSGSSDISIQQHTDPVNSNNDEIIEILPKRAKEKAASLLHLIKDHVTWNGRGEVTIKGQFFAGSHICDLLKFAIFNTLNRKKFPIAHKPFCDLLHQLNVPKSLMYGSVDSTVADNSTGWHSI